MKQKIKRLFAKRPYRKATPEKSLQDAIQDIPRITNETVAEHREEVLGSARKFIYPLQHSLKRIVSISIVIFIVLGVSFVVYCLLALYRFDVTSTFMYRVTQVIPFPVARIGTELVSYENYLFEVRRFKHYYESQQQVDFNSDSGKQQLEDFRTRALNLVINDAYIKNLAKKHKVSVSDQEVNDEVTLLRAQNRLGSNQDIFEDVLKEFWGWSLADFKRELRQQLLAQKVVSRLDVGTHDRAKNVYTQLYNGGDFTAIAKQFSEDPGTKDNGGDYGIAIDRTNRDLAPQVIDELFKLEPGQISAIFETPIGLEIVKVNEKDGTTVRAAHIFFAFQDIRAFVEPLKEQKKPQTFLRP